MCGPTVRDRHSLERGLARPRDIRLDVRRRSRREGAAFVMEITCPICGEMWALECLHEEVVARNGGLPEGSTYDARLRDVRDDFQVRGCEAVSRIALTPHRSGRQRTEPGSRAPSA